MKYGILSLLLFCSCNVAVASEHRCSAVAVEQAKKLLAFHFEEEISEMGFEDPSLMTPIKNPANPKQKLDVLEVIGYISPHGQYRMRFIYLPGSCLLMGQEILEHAIP